MATSSGVSCGSCLKTGKNKVAIIWCSDCESGLCGVCRYQHNISNTTINHKTTPVGEFYQGAQMPIRSRTMQLRIVRKFDVAKADSPKPEISAFCLLPNKNFVFVDRAGFFTICDKDGSFQERFSMNCMSAYDMVSIDNSSIALASRSEGHEDGPYVCLVDIKKRR
ncbi:unnamed protein product [Mytilus edulis]|uniref:B box-type domain-containing protein n=1 Tax=Mytilus edulis TaxID=6550 RepID=A0A8S3UJ60_MYTED|nr:unnamed protein product [Mytilus edulis]